MNEIKYESSLYCSARYICPISLRITIIRLQGPLLHDASLVRSTLIH
jgi:hypothetical protein